MYGGLNQGYGGQGVVQQDIVQSGPGGRSEDIVQQDGYGNTREVIEQAGPFGRSEEVIQQDRFGDVSDVRTSGF